MKRQMQWITALVLVSLFPQSWAAGEPEKIPDGVPTKMVLGRKWISNAARKGFNTANAYFLNRPEGKAYKQRLVEMDDELNAVYEKYLNICYTDPDTEEGRKLLAEKQKALGGMLEAKRRIGNQYEKLKNESPEYRAKLKEALEFWHEREMRTARKRAKTGAEMKNSDQTGPDNAKGGMK